jgi:hypothetical protein
MRTAGSILGIVLAAALGACAHHQAQTAAQAPEQAQAATACPMAQIPGVHASVADIDKGVAITFTGPHDALDSLRDDVHKMAEANDRQGDAFAVCPCASMTSQGAAEAMPPGQSGAARTPPLKSIPASSSVQDIDTGAVLKLQVKNKSDVPALRDAVRQNVRSLREGCLSRQAPSEQPYEPGGQQP